MNDAERVLLVETWRQRQVLTRAEGDMVRRVKALSRRAGLPKDDPVILLAAEPFIAAMDVLHRARLRQERQLRRLARLDPVWEWAQDVRGLGELGVASLIAEAGGDLRAYPTHSKLWRRMGLAVSDDGRAQARRLGPAGELEGYAPQRRAVSYNLASAVLRAQSATNGFYRQIYDERRRYEEARTQSPRHAHNRAQRYMEKRLVRDFWRAARRDIEASRCLPQGHKTAASMAPPRGSGENAAAIQAAAFSPRPPGPFDGGTETAGRGGFGSGAGPITLGEGLA